MSLNAQDKPVASDGKSYVIENVSYEIEGRTWEYALDLKLDIRRGMTFAGKQELESYLADKQQVLMNQRVIAAGSVTYSEKPRPDGSIGVQVLVKSEDTWNFVVLPYAKYDSNDGLLLALRGRDFNFLGSMQTLELDLDYTFNLGNSDPKKELKQALNFEVPFKLLDRNWRFGIEEELSFDTQSDDLDFKLKESVAIDFLRAEGFEKEYWTLKFSQGYYFNGNDDDYGDTLYHESRVSFGTNFELPLMFGKYSIFKYAPGVFTQVKYRPGRELSEDRRGFEAGFAHGVTASRIDWIGDYRDGASVSLTNTNTYNFERTDWEKLVEWEFIGHKAFSWCGLSGRFKGFYDFDKELGDNSTDDVGSAIRGVLDDRLRGDRGIFVNADFLVSMWTWFLEKWFEVQAGPFLDVGYVHPKNASFSKDDIWYGGGIQVIVFPKFARSLYIRASLGFDLQAVYENKRLTGNSPRDGESVHEIFIGLGHAY